MKKIMTISLTIAVCITVSANANVLVNPGFETNSLTSATNVLTNFPGFQGVWGPEAGTIVTAENGVTPIQGVQMLRMVDTGSYTQTFQITDVTASAGLIDSGGAVINAYAQFNVDKALSAALGVISVSFFTTSTYGSLIGSSPIASLTLDTSPVSWQPISLSSAIPVGTRWILTQVAYQDATLFGIDGQYHPGYVDAADTTISQIPEPATIGMLVLGALGLWKKRKNSR
jgi:hypothetical protein